MSELDDSLQARAPDTTKPEKIKLSELLSVCLDGSSGMPDSTPEKSSGRTLPDGTAASGSTSGEAKSADAGKAPAKEETVEKLDLIATDSSSHNPVPSKKNREERAPRASKSTFAVWQAAGLILAAIGSLLVVAPHLSAQLAKMLDSHSELRAQAGTLIVGGLLLFTIGLLRHTLRDIRSSLDAVSSETARLEEIARDGHALRDTLSNVRIENTVLRDDVVRLQTKIKRLIEIVSNPDYTMSIFRLAASVDQLGKRVEVFMQEQFGLLEKRADAIVQHANQVEQRLTSTLGQIDGSMKQQYKAQQLAVKEGFDELGTASDQASAQMEQNLQAAARIEELIQSQQQAVSSGLSILSDHTTLNANQVASCVNELRGRIDRQIESQDESLRAEFEELKKKLDLAERNHASGIKQFTEQIRGQFANHVDGLQQNLKLLSELTSRGNQEIAGEFDGLEQNLKLLTELTSRGNQEVAGEFDGVEQNLKLLTELTSRGNQEVAGEFDGVEQSLKLLAELTNRGNQEASEEFDGLQQDLKQLAELTSRGHLEIAGEFDGLEARIDGHSKDQQTSLQQIREQAIEATKSGKDDLAENFELLGTQLDQLGRDHLAALHRTCQETQQTAGASKRELAANLDQLKAQLEQQTRDHLAALRKISQEAAQTAGATKHEFSASLGKVREHLEQLSRDHLAALHQSALDSQQAAGATKRELAASLEHIGMRIETTLEVRAADLANAMTEVTEMFDSITADVRACLSEPSEPEAASKDDVESSVEAMIEIPRVEDGGPCSENPGPPPEIV